MKRIDLIRSIKVDIFFISSIDKIENRVAEVAWFYELDYVEDTNSIEDDLRLNSVAS